MILSSIWYAMVGAVFAVGFSQLRGTQHSPLPLISRDMGVPPCTNPTQTKNKQGQFIQ